VTRRVPVLLRFSECAAVQGATVYSDLPDHIGHFVDSWIRQHEKTVKRQEHCHQLREMRVIRLNRCLVVLKPTTPGGDVLTKPCLLLIRYLASFRIWSTKEDQIIEVFYGLVKYMSVKKKERRQSLILGGSTYLPFNRKMGQISLDISACQLLRIGTMIKPVKPLYPVEITFFGSTAVVSGSCTTVKDFVHPFQ
jgi:hypothetical protein